MSGNDVPAPRARRSLLRITAPAVCGGLVAGLAVGTVDAMVAGSGFGLALALYSATGVAIGLAFGLAVAGVAVHLPADAGPWTSLRRDGALDATIAASLVAGAVCLGLEVCLVYLFAAGPAAGMANPTLAALSTALVAGVGVVVSVFVFLPLLHVLRSGPIGLVPRAGTVTLTVVLLLGGLLAVLFVVTLGSVDWRIIGFAPWVTLFVLAALALGLGHFVLARISVLRRPVALVAALGVGAAGAAVSPLCAGPDIVASLGGRGLLLPVLVRVARSAGDSDGDGFARSGWFGGADCDDSNPAINPAARDIPGNGIDENCHGGDARSRPPRGKPKAPAARAEDRRQLATNVLLVCVDTLRADKLGVMGHKGGLTPTMDALAARGVLFSRVMAQGPNTPQSFPSIFTSSYPTRIPFYKRFTGYPRLKPEALTVFEVLSEHGVQTSAVSSHFYFKTRRGITQGIADWDNRGATNIKDSNKDISAPRIVPRAIAKLKALAAAKKRFVLFVHLSEPHSTYVKHPGLPITERGVAGLQQKYDYEIKFVDAWLSKLLDGVRSAGLQDSTAVVLFSDHGEAFGEHRLYFHGQTLYNEVLHVPLIVALPRPGPPRVVDKQAALIDVAPTLLDIMGLPIPETFQGISLVGLLGGGGTAPRRRSVGAVLMAYPAWPRGQRAMVLGQHKVIWRLKENVFEVYDMGRDPGEKNNLWPGHADARRLEQEIKTFAEQEL